MAKLNAMECGKVISIGFFGTKHCRGRMTRTLVEPPRGLKTKGPFSGARMGDGPIYRYTCTRCGHSYVQEG